MTRESEATTGPEASIRAGRDLRLIGSYRNGNRDAIDDLLQAYDAYIRRIIIRLAIPSSDLEDVRQDVCIRIYLNLHRFSGESSFYTWLYRITVNACFDYLRTRKRADLRAARLLSLSADRSIFARDLAEDPDLACQETLVSDALRAAIDLLPQTFRKIVEMREIDDLSYGEISAQAGIAVGTVRSRLFRARVRLRELLAPAITPAAA